MSLVTANGYGVVACDFVLPISRVWHVDMTLALTDPSQVTGKVAISINGGALTMNGTGTADVFNDTVRARVVAGAGGLPKTATPKFYRQPTVKIVLQDLLTTAGETLSTTASAAVLGQTLPAWTVSQMPIADAIGLLMSEVNASWRMLPDGTFWCGAETWPDSGLSLTIEKDDKAHQLLEVTLEAPLLLPGTSINGRHISYIETHVDANKVVSRAWMTTPNSYDRLRDSSVAVTNSAVPHIDYLGMYRCRVVAQSLDLLSLDLAPDDPRLPQAGVTAPLRHGLPGCKVQVPSGVYVRLGWDGGDQSKPYCALWDGGESPQSIQIAGNTPAARKNDPVGNGTIQFTFGAGTGAATLVVVYTPGDGSAVQTLAAGSGTITLKELIQGGSSIVGLG